MIDKFDGHLWIGESDATQRDLDPIGEPSGTEIRLDHSADEHASLGLLDLIFDKASHCVEGETENHGVHADLVAVLEDKVVSPGE